MKKWFKSLFTERTEENMAGQPWYIRRGPTIFILAITLIFAIFCAVWSHFFPYGIF